MALVDDVADKLAERALDEIERTGDENLEQRVAQEIGASSPTLQEAYLTAMRIRKAERRAVILLDKYSAGAEIPVAQISSMPQDDVGGGGGH